MRLILIISILTCLSAWPQYLQAQDTGDKVLFTLEECIKYALENNEDVTHAGYARDIAKAQVGETTAQGLPQINGSAELARNLIIQQVIVPAIFINPDAAEGEVAALPFSTNYTGLVNVSATQMIFDGSYFVGLKAARTFLELSRKDEVKSKIDVTEAVSKAYYAVLVSLERLPLINENYSRLDTLLRETTLMYENGFAEKIDVDRVRVQFNNVKVERQNIERQIILSYSLLKFQMGMGIHEEIALADKLSDIEFEVPDYDFENFGYENRIEYSQMQTNRDLAQLDLRNNTAQYLPKLSAFASYGANMGTNTSSKIFNFDDTWFANSSIGARLEIPIFDGLLKSYRIQNNRIQIAQAENQLRKLKNNIDLEIQQSSINLKNSVEAMEAQKENLALAEEVFRVTKIKFQQGVGSNIEVIDAEIAFKEAETNYFNALYDALVSKVDLQKALGTLLE